MKQASKILKRIYSSPPTSAIVSFNIEPLNYGGNPPLWTLFIKFDVAIATLKSLRKVTVLEEYLSKTDIEKAG